MNATTHNSKGWIFFTMVSFAVAVGGRADGPHLGLNFRHGRAAGDIGLGTDGFEEGGTTGDDQPGQANA